MLDIEIHKMRKFSKKYRNKYLKGIELLKKVVNSEEFEYLVCHFQYQHDGFLYKGFKRSYVDGIYLNPTQVYMRLMSGKDKFNLEEDHDIDIDVALYYRRWSNAIGYTTKKTWRTWINKKFFKKKSFTPEKICGNILHEYCHNLGFTHSPKHNPTRKFSVPYALGRIARDIASRMEENNPNFLIKGVVNNGKMGSRSERTEDVRTLWE